MPTARSLAGEVVDGQGKPVADVRVVFYAPPIAYLNGDAVEVNTTSNSKGEFSLVVPQLRRAGANGIHLLGYGPGRALAAKAFFERPHRLVLTDPRPRTVKVEGPDGQPVAGARVVLRMFYAFSGALAEVPVSLADSLATTTAPDGTTTIGYLGARDKLVAVRITADQIGAQDFLLLEDPLRGSEPLVITIKLKKTSSISGRLVDEQRQPLAGQLVEIWSNRQGVRLLPSLVGFKQGPVRTDADGSFCTPANLLQGSAYRVAIRAPGKDPIFSDWITVQDKPHNLGPLVQRTLRTVRGAVLDRQGNPVSGARVFQTGDGPERTETTTDANGLFVLGGFRHGPVFFFVRSAGFRFHGQLVKPSDVTVRATLARDDEPPAVQMKSLPDLISLDESRALARRLLEPCWKVIAASDDRARYQYLEALLPADPGGVLEKLSSLKFNDERARFLLLSDAVLVLAERDHEEAASLAESIADPATRSGAFIHLADRLPASQRDRKLRCSTGHCSKPESRPGKAIAWLRWATWPCAGLSSGRPTRRKRCSPKCSKSRIKSPIRPISTRGMFAASLARVDLPAAEAIVRDFKDGGNPSTILGNMALSLAELSPTDAERLWLQTEGRGRLAKMDPVLCWKLAGIDPAGAVRIIEGWPIHQTRPQCYFYLALGAKARDQAISRQSFRAGLQGLDRIMDERPDAITLQRRGCCPWSSKSIRHWCPRFSGAISHRVSPTATREPVMRHSRAHWSRSSPRTIAKWPRRFSLRRSHAWNKPNRKSWRPGAGNSWLGLRSTPASPSRGSNGLRSLWTAGSP